MVRGNAVDAAARIHYQSAMLIARADDIKPLIDDPAGVLAILLSVLAVIFWLTKHPYIGRLFKVVPALVFCYFIPTTLTTFGVIPDGSPLYTWVKTFLLPASLLLLILSLDLPGIIRLGPKAGIMLLAGTAGVVIGGPISLFLCSYILPSGWGLPDDVWKGMTALAGSWIGGGANFVALGEVAGATKLLILSLDLPGIIRLGPKAGIMLLAGTAGVVIGGPISLFLCSYILPSGWGLPDDVWKGMTALAGSWIGGGANFVALGEVAGADETMMATMVIPDVMVGSIWMGALLYMAGVQHKIDARTGANVQAIRDLEQRMTEFQERGCVHRVAANHRAG